MALTMKDLAEKDKKVSLVWAANAIRALTELENALKRKGSPSSFATSDLPAFKRVRDGLQAHFNIDTAADQTSLVTEVLGRYRLGVTTLKTSSTIFVNDTTSAEAAKGTPAHVPFGSGRVNFTPAFKEFDARTGTGFGPFARAAMVLHEPFHIVDHPAASSGPNHIHEGSIAYATTPAANQVHNAHSYASFAQQMNFGRDTRFGATKPQFCRWADGQMGRWADGQMGRWADGQMGRWADGQMGRPKVADFCHGETPTDFEPAGA